MSEIKYAFDYQSHRWNPDWVPFSKETVLRTREYRAMGFLAAHDQRVHTPTNEVPVDEIGSDTIQRIGQHLLQKNNEVWRGAPAPGSGLTANQIDLSEFTSHVPSISVMWVEGAPLLVVNPKVEYPEDFNPFGDQNVESEGCLNLTGGGGGVALADSLALRGYTLDARPIEIEVADKDGVERRNVSHEYRHTLGKLYPEFVFGANRQLWRVNREEFNTYRAWQRGEDVGSWHPDPIPRSQYNAWTNAQDSRMKTDTFRIPR